MIKLTRAEAKEKRHNPWYCKECRREIHVSYGCYYDERAGKDFEIPFCPVCGTYNIVEKPRRETPEKYRSRTGRRWGDDSAVYMRTGKNGWRILSYREAKSHIRFCKTQSVPCKIYCANSDAGIPKRREE
jgi:hypothetical protein